MPTSSSGGPRQPNNYVEYQTIALEHQNLIAETLFNGNEVSRQEKVLALNNLPFWENQMPINCVLCPSHSAQVNAKNGLILKTCLHHFCKNCLSQHICNTHTVHINCPFPARNKEPECDQNLKPSEVEALVSKVEFDRHYVQLLLKDTEASIQNGFHCLTPNCQGFCLKEDINFRPYFTCPVCSTVSCIKCKNAHNYTISCDQFQKEKAEQDRANRTAEISKQLRELDELRELMQTANVSASNRESKWECSVQ